MMGRAMRAAGLAAALAAVYGTAVRPRQLTWGATAEEAAGALPGDELVVDPDLVATRCVTIHATTDRVWPWIAQIGQGRGGFYSYDALENLVGCEIHSADRIVPEWQHLREGDEVRLHPEVALAVAVVRPGNALVLRGAVPPGGTRGEAPYEFTWTFALRAGPDGSTRLLVRERYGYTRWWTAALVEPVVVVSFVMTRRMLEGIRVRAERF